MTKDLIAFHNLEYLLRTGRFFLFKTPKQSSSNIICIFQIYGSADRYANESLFCAQNHTYGVDTCQGDSGGPITCSKDGLNYMYGITSFGVGCNDKKYPGNSSS